MRTLRGEKLLGLALALTIALGAPGAAAQDNTDWKRVRREAQELYEQNKFAQALPLFESLVKQEPADLVLLERLGFVILATANSIPDPEKRRQERVRARALLLRSKELGNDSNLLKIILEQLPENGESPAFSDNAEVDSAMNEGETAFSAGEFDKAIAAYTRALLLNPHLYEAPLFIGDTYYKMGKLGSAGEWYARAIEANPNRETAYRYWGDALMAAGDWEQAREKFIDAIVAEPYRQASWVGLLQWAKRRKLELRHPRIDSPNKLEQGEKTQITIDISTLTSKDGSSAWMMYEIIRSSWKSELFAATYPQEKEYRHSLREEAAALGVVAASVREQLKTKQIKQAQPALATLVELDDSGLLEPFILLAKANPGIRQDYGPYRELSRNRIRRYIRRYVIPSQGFAGGAEEQKRIGDEHRRASTPQELARAVEVARALENDPLGPNAEHLRRELMLWVTDAPEFTVTVCKEPLPFLMGKDKNFAPELWGNYVLAMGAFLIENPAKAADHQAVQMAGVESTLRAYQAVLKKEPKAKWKELDKMLELREKGMLAQSLAPRFDKCKSTDAKSERITVE